MVGEGEGRVLDGSAASPRFLSAGTVAVASTCGTHRITRLEYTEAKMEVGNSYYSPKIALQI